MTVPLLLLSGFFASADNFAPYLIPFKYLSMFKYGYQTLIHNEFIDSSPLTCLQSTPDMCSPMASRFTFLEPYYICFIAVASLVVFFNAIALFILWKTAKIKV